MVAVRTRNGRAIGWAGGRGLFQAATASSPKTVHVRTPPLSAIGRLPALSGPILL
jgi:hypothetical protein